MSNTHSQQPHTRVSKHKTLHTRCGAVKLAERAQMTGGRCRTCPASRAATDLHGSTPLEQSGPPLKTRKYVLYQASRSFSDWNALACGQYYYKWDENAHLFSQKILVMRSGVATNTKLPVTRVARHEVDDAAAPVTATPRFTHAACSQRTQSSARAQTGRASSNSVRACPPSAWFSQPRRLCAADSRRSRERNLPPLSRSRVAQGRASWEQTKERVRQLWCRASRRECTRGDA